MSKNKLKTKHLEAPKNPIFHKVQMIRGNVQLDEELTEPCIKIRGSELMNYFGVMLVARPEIQPEIFDNQTRMVPVAVLYDTDGMTDYHFETMERQLDNSYPDIDFSEADWETVWAAAIIEPLTPELNL